MIFRALLIFAILAVSLRAQQPSPSPTPSAEVWPAPSPSPSPSPSPTQPVQTMREIIDEMKDEDVEKALRTFTEGFFDT